MNLAIVSYNQKPNNSVDTVFLQSAVSNVKTETGIKLNQEDVTRVLNDVQLLKGKQDNMTAKMDKMKK